MHPERDRMLAFQPEKTSMQSVPSQQDDKEMRDAEARNGLSEEEEIRLLIIRIAGEGRLAVSEKGHFSLPLA